MVVDKQIELFQKLLEKKMSINSKGRIPWNKGKKATKEAIKNQSESHKGLSCPYKWKSVISTNLLTGEEKEYKNIVSATKDGFWDSAISRVAKGLASHHKGFSWRYK